MSQLEAAGIVGPQNSSKNRDVLVSTFSELDEIIKKYGA
jgi:DNA segregation ATPase FtsK/SpoIIIE-like protein